MNKKQKEFVQPRPVSAKYRDLVENEISDFDKFKDFTKINSWDFDSKDRETLADELVEMKWILDYKEREVKYLKVEVTKLKKGTGIKWELDSEDVALKDLRNPDYLWDEIWKLKEKLNEANSEKQDLKLALNKLWKFLADMKKEN